MHFSINSLPSTRFGVSLDYLFHGESDMFRAAKTIKEKKKDLEDDKTMNTENLVRLIEISPLFKYQVLGFAAKFRYDNDAIINQDIENYSAKMSKDR